MRDKMTMTPENREAVKPCPFCGEKPKLCEDDSNGNSFVLCGCPVEPSAQATAGHIRDAIQLWNRRPVAPVSEDALAAEAERLIEAEFAKMSRNPSDWESATAFRNAVKAALRAQAPAPSDVVAFYERHHRDFDGVGNYIPHSQIDGDLRAANDRIAALEATIAEARASALEEAAGVAETLVYNPPTDGEMEAWNEAADHIAAAIRKLKDRG